MTQVTAPSDARCEIGPFDAEVSGLVFVLQTLPAFVSALLVAAHFLRAGNGSGVAVALAVAILAWIPRRAADLAVSVALLAGTLEWSLTAWRIARIRIGLGQPYGRMLAILGIVAALCLFAAWAHPRRSRRAPGGPMLPGASEAARSRTR